jgi:hypothetical protein
MPHKLQILCVALYAGVLMVPTVFAATFQEATVDFDPAVTASLQKTYGSHESGVLRLAILAALASRERQIALPNGLTLKVRVQRIAPTHPTMKQQLDDPSLNPARTRYLGGAALIGEIRDPKEQVLATVDYSNFVGVLREGAPSLDPWADARVTIGAFASKLAAAWDKLPKS